MKRRNALALVASSAAALMPRTAGATLACPALALKGTVTLIGNSFPAIAHLARVAEGCSGAGLKVSTKLTPQARVETEQAFAASSPSPFDAAFVSMGVFSNLYARRHLQPLTDLVRQHGARFALEEKMLVRVDGEVMAIAFLQNTQNLYFRRDLFERHRIAVPTTYAEMAAAAALLRTREPGLRFPIAQGFAKGFDSATEFTNVLASLGGRFFERGSARPAFHGEAGVGAVEAMRSLLPHMTPNALASNSDDVVNQFQQGQAAMGVLWASRAARMDDPVASRVVGRMDFAAAPAARAGGPTAAHLWWDGVVLPRNNPARRDATFQVLMHALSADSVRAGNDLAIWVRSAYRPGRFGVGVALAQAAGAPVWPGEPFFSLAHGEVGKVLPDALAGERSPQAALQAAASAYARAAIDKGFLAPGRGMKLPGFAAFTAPSVLLMLLLLLLPMLGTLWLSVRAAPELELATVQQSGPFGTHEVTTQRARVDAAGRPLAVCSFVGLDHYRTILGLRADEAGGAAATTEAPKNEFLAALRFTLLYVVATTPFVLAGGLALALAMNRVTQRLKGVFIAASLLPFIITPVVGALAIKWLFRDGGLVPQLLSQVGVQVFWMAQAWSAQLLIVLYGIWHVLPFAFIVFYAGLQGVPQDALEAATIDGASRWQKLRYVTMPHLAPLVVFVTMIHLMDAYRVFEPVLVLTQGAFTTSVQYLTYHVLLQEDNPYKAGAAAVLTIVGIALLLVPLLRRTWREQRQGA